MLFQLTPSALPEGYGEALVPLALVKSWCRIRHDEQDALLAVLRDAAMDMVEKTGNLRMGPQTGLVAVFEAFGPGMRVGRGIGEPMTVTAISYLDGDGASQDIADGGWRIDAGGGIVPAIGARWPVRGTAVSVTFDAGYPAGRCPALLKTAALMFVAHLMINPEAVVTGTITAEVPLGSMEQIERYRYPVI
jgi:uncharacterized phiE125 gp8 family phage protein